MRMCSVSYVGYQSISPLKPSGLAGEVSAFFASSTLVDIAGDPGKIARSFTR